MMRTYAYSLLPLAILLSPLFSAFFCPTSSSLAQLCFISSGVVVSRTAHVLSLESFCGKEYRHVGPCVGASRYHPGYQLGRLSHYRGLFCRDARHRLCTENAYDFFRGFLFIGAFTTELGDGPGLCRC